MVYCINDSMPLSNSNDLVPQVLGQITVLVNILVMIKQSIAFLTYLYWDMEVCGKISEGKHKTTTQHSVFMELTSCCYPVYL